MFIDKRRLRSACTYPELESWQQRSAWPKIISSSDTVSDIFAPMIHFSKHSFAFFDTEAYGLDTVHSIFELEKERACLDGTVG